MAYWNLFKGLWSCVWQTLQYADPLEKKIDECTLLHMHRILTFTLTVTEIDLQMTNIQIGIEDSIRNHCIVLFGGRTSPDPTWEVRCDRDQTFQEILWAYSALSVTEFGFDNCTQLWYIHSCFINFKSFTYPFHLQCHNLVSGVYKTSCRTGETSDEVKPSHITSYQCLNSFSDDVCICVCPDAQWSSP